MTRNSPWRALNSQQRGDATRRVATKYGASRGCSETRHAPGRRRSRTAASCGRSGRASQPARGQACDRTGIAAGQPRRAPSGARASLADLAKASRRSQRIADGTGRTEGRAGKDDGAAAGRPQRISPRCPNGSSNASRRVRTREKTPTATNCTKNIKPKKSDFLSR